MAERMPELGMTQRMLAEKMNHTQQYVSKVLKGHKNMSLETICKNRKRIGYRNYQRSRRKQSIMQECGEKKIEGKASEPVARSNQHSTDD